MTSRIARSFHRIGVVLAVPALLVRWGWPGMRRGGSGTREIHGQASQRSVRRPDTLSLTIITSIASRP